ncbi:hypothetical protein BU16DRAFT_579199 [Lophium mytilinum]|uniref:BTB domain-containing protein n=1 Tax=Lophium mytilinum TaxID=390894 RepID=A0A6A6R559_9PEZI|nr:hypothetical protein BU16DRAFT_579199 [Lophium mytilinum]
MTRKTPSSSFRVSKTSSPRCCRAPQERVASSVRRICGTDIVTIHTSSRLESFCVHRGLISYWSPYFRNACNGSFKEAGEKEINLEDVRPSVFKSFVAWMYSQNIVLDKPTVRLPEPENTGCGDSDQTLVEKLAAKELSTLFFKRGEDIEPETKSSAVEYIDRLRRILRVLRNTYKAEGEGRAKQLTLLSQFVDRIKVMTQNLHVLRSSIGLFQVLEDIIDAPEKMLPGPLGEACKESARLMLDEWKVIGLQAREDTAARYSDLVDLYIFANKYDIKQLRIDVIEFIHAVNRGCVHFVPDLRAVSKAFHKLPPTSGLYRYFVDVYVDEWDGRHSGDHGAALLVVEQLFPKSVLVEVMMRRSAKLHQSHERMKPQSDHISLCSYHDHHSK